MDRWAKALGIGWNSTRSCFRPSEGRPTISHALASRRSHPLVLYRIRPMPGGFVAVDGEAPRHAVRPPTCGSRTVMRTRRLTGSPTRTLILSLDAVFKRARPCLKPVFVSEGEVFGLGCESYNRRVAASSFSYAVSLSRQSIPCLHTATATSSTHARIRVEPPRRTSYSVKGPKTDVVMFSSLPPPLKKHPHQTPAPTHYRSSSAVSDCSSRRSCFTLSRGVPPGSSDHVVVLGDDLDVHCPRSSFAAVFSSERTSARLLSTPASIVSRLGCRTLNTLKALLNAMLDPTLFFAGVRPGATTPAPRAPGGHQEPAMGPFGIALRDRRRAVRALWLEEVTEY